MSDSHALVDAAMLSFETIEDLERALLASGECFHLEADHHFANGQYYRTIVVPADSIITGHEHLDRHVVVLAKGDITVWAKGEPHRRLKAPCMFTVEAGSRRVGITHAETIWTTIHITDLTDVAEWERTRLAPHAFLPIPSEASDLFIGPTYEDAIRTLGFSAKQVRAISENLDDQIPFPTPASVTVADSPIEGMGLFATESFSRGDVIAPSRIGGKRTPAGRYCNHSANPNTKMVMERNGDVALIAVKDVARGDELTNDYVCNFLNSRI